MEHDIPSDSKAESILSDPEDTDLDIPFTSPRKTLQQSKYKCQKSYKYFINTHSKDTADPLPPIQPPSTVDEIKYIVFKSSLMELFRKCMSCCNVCNGEVAYQKGTFVAIKQMCSHCGHQRLWKSHPHIKDTPAGNPLLSAGILFSGATPGKIFQLLDHMRVAYISDRTFYYHQSQYLQSTVLYYCNCTYIHLHFGWPSIFTVAPTNCLT